MNNEMYFLYMKSILFCHHFKISTIVQDLISSKIMSAQKKVQEVLNLSHSYACN